MFDLSLTVASDFADGLRALDSQSSGIDPSQMTVESCLDACEAQGYFLAGVEWSRECCECVEKFPEQANSVKSVEILLLATIVLLAHINVPTLAQVRNSLLFNCRSLG